MADPLNFRGKMHPRSEDYFFLGEKNEKNGSEDGVNWIWLNLFIPYSVLKSIEIKNFSKMAAPCTKICIHGLDQNRRGPGYPILGTRIARPNPKMQTKGAFV